MIVVRVELHSAITRKVTELARMNICNTGLSSSHTKADYVGETLPDGDEIAAFVGSTLRGRNAAALDVGNVTRRGEVLNHKRQALHVWHLVSKMLRAMNYGDDKRIRCLGCPRCPDCPERDLMPAGE